MKSTEKIAMKVTKEEFNDILPVLKENGLVKDNDINEWSEEKCHLVNIRVHNYEGVNLYYANPLQYKTLTYNKELFLQYCGIEPKKETNFMSLDGSRKEVKETVFTSFVSRDAIIEAVDAPMDYKNVLHIGYDSYYNDVFKCWDDDINDFRIYFGTAGDEFKKQ